MVLNQNLFQYESDIVLWNESDGFVTREWKRFKAILEIPGKYDIVHFNYGNTLAGVANETIAPMGRGLRQVLKSIVARAYRATLRRFELVYLRARGVKMVVTFQGDDARQGDYCLANFEITTANHVEEGYYSKRSDRSKRKTIRLLHSFCGHFYSVNPDLCHVLPESTKFTPYAHVDPDEWKPIYPVKDNRPLKILHAPTHRRVKGTARILEALENLKGRGYSFELELVENLPYSEARKRYEKADVLIDQIYAGWYGGLAVELMALGKPVACYIREGDLQFIPERMRAQLPIVRINHSDLELSIKRLFEFSRSELRELGHVSRKFVEDWHSPATIARSLSADYSGLLAGSEAGRKS
ncbi:MAG: hypothetical protein CMF59_02925 [Leptospiraceae bacterium]|nr:hypothetical protein [Leptospiraceae bacterium]